MKNAKSQINIIKKATITSALTNIILAFLKIIMGILGQSQALVADGFHSLSDVLGDTLIFFAAKAARRNPDENHPYGHQRIETISVIAVALILIFIGFSILYSAFKELLTQGAQAPPDIWVFITALFSVLVNEWLFRYMLKKGEQTESALLISAAWHNRSDALTSLIVVGSVLGSYVGIPYLDLIGAIIIAIIIVKMGLKMIWNSSNELIDAGLDSETLKRIQKILSDTPSIISIHNLRSRKHGSKILLDAHIQVPPDISVSEGHYIGDQAMIALKKNFSSISDVTIHIDAEDDNILSKSSKLPPRKDIIADIRDLWSSIEPKLTIETIQLHYIKSSITVDAILLLSNDKSNDLHAISKTYSKALENHSTISAVNIYFTTEPIHQP